MGVLVPYSPADRIETERLLAHPDGLHLYLLSRLDPAERGRAVVYRDEGRILGCAWFGPGHNLVVAGEDPGFIEALAEYARDIERTWIMVVGPLGPVSDLLETYLGSTRRRPRLDRTQAFYVQRPETLAELREPDLEVAQKADLRSLSAAAARMSAEDFDIDPFRIDRAAVRRTTMEKIHEHRAFLLRRSSRLAFKADVGILLPEGAQVEGVYTAEAFRGRGVASRCMAELGHRLLRELPLLCLHVAERNEPAKRAYENAGYRRVTELRLAIFPPASARRPGFLRGRS